ncbi:MAG: hypothetical protein U5R06_09160 [candidate division KSB1 bacterium]|nr:hypothetical protein [candidate division KSB1 bacterium]
MKFLQFVFVIYLAAAWFVHADSYYSSFGLGMPEYSVSVASAGRGGAGIAVREPHSLNLMNPATLQLDGLTTIALSVDYQVVNNQFDQKSAYTRNGNAAGFAFAVPVSQYFGAFVGLKPLASSKYMVSYEIKDELASYQREVTGKGGLTAANAGFQIQALKWLSLSAVANFNFGTFSEIWETRFDEDLYLNSSDDISSHIYGLAYNLGLYMEPWTSLAVGLTYSSASKLSIENQIIPGTGVALDISEQNCRYPQSFAAGVAVPLKTLTFAADAYYQLWSNYSINGNKNQEMTDFWRISAGLEYLNTLDQTEPYYKRIDYRMGGHIAQLPFLDPNGNAVSEMFVSAGLGFPFHSNMGRLDLAVQYGTRYESLSDGYQETIYRLVGSITSSEKWFQRLF